MTTCICDLLRSSPSTHSQYPVMERVRGRPELLVIVSCTNFTGSCSATKIVSSEAIPSSACSNIVLPIPCRTTYVPRPRAG